MRKRWFTWCVSVERRGKLMELKIQLIRDVKPNDSFLYISIVRTIKVFYMQPLVDLLPVYFIPAIYKTNFVWMKKYEDSDHFYYFDTHKLCANFGIMLNITRKWVNRVESL